MVLVPEGWLNFNGGGSDPDLCSESPPPPIVIEPSMVDLRCDPNGYILTLTATGGVLPLIWATSGGSVTVLDERHATVDIGNPDYLGDHDEKVGSIAYFKPHYFSFSGGLTSGCVPSVPGGNYVSATVDTRLRAYDCLKRHIDGLAGAGNIIDNIQVDDTNSTDDLDNPIGDNPADRTCDIAVNWEVVDPDNPSRPHSDPTHWSVAADGCNPAGDAGSVSIHVTAQLAGKNGIHGTIHSGAPAFSEIVNVVPLPIAAAANPGWLDPDTNDVYNTDFPSGTFLDVRTQVQVDTECCVVPSGTDVIVTVIDAAGAVAVIVIPVVEPT